VCGALKLAGAHLFNAADEPPAESAALRNCSRHSPLGRPSAKRASKRVLISHSTEGSKAFPTATN